MVASMGGEQMKIDLGQIKSSTIQSQVYHRLREALFMGAFSPGESLTIRNLADEMGVSPMPVRESLQRLVAEHALLQMPNRTFRVMPFTPEMFRELIRVRMTVEGLAAAAAARRITPAELRRLSQINATMIRGVDDGDATQVMNANRLFHFTLYEIAAMPQLLDIINGLWLRAGPYLMNAHRNLEDPSAFFRSGTMFHKRIIACCADHQPKQAARAMACDIWLSARHFRRNVERINVAEYGGGPVPKRRNNKTKVKG